MRIAFGAYYEFIQRTEVTIHGETEMQLWKG
jgi:hypothetical protein